MFLFFSIQEYSDDLYSNIFSMVDLYKLIQRKPNDATDKFPPSKTRIESRSHTDYKDISAFPFGNLILFQDTKAIAFTELFHQFLIV